jgi:hypothetical protein
MAALCAAIILLDFEQKVQKSPTIKEALGATFIVGDFILDSTQKTLLG